MTPLKRLTLTAVASTMLAGNALAQQTKLVVNSILPPKHPFNTEVLLPWAEDVKKATNGRIVIEVPPTSAAPPPQVMDATQKGVVDGGFQFHAFVANRIKLGQLPHLPWGSGSVEAMSIAYWRTHEKYLAAANEFKDVHLLSLFTLPAAELMSLKAPITSIKQLDGMKVYALPGTAQKLMESAKAGVVAAPAVRSHEIVSSGQVDAMAGISVSDARTFNTLQYVKSITLLPGNLNSPSFSLFLNKAKWDGLSKEDKDAITKLSGEAFAKRLAGVDVAAKAGWDEAKRLNIQMVPASAELIADMKKASQPIEDAWLADAKAAGVDGAAALAFYRAQVKELTK